MDPRREFAEFLRHLSTGSVGAIEWQRFVATHYQNLRLEEIRREVARMNQDRDGGKEWSDAELQKMQYWARELREAASE